MEDWEGFDGDTGDGDYRKATPEEEKAVDDALGLEKIILRLPKCIVNDLKELAARQGVNHVYLMREAIENYTLDYYK